MTQGDPRMTRGACRMGYAERMWRPLRTRPAGTGNSEGMDLATLWIVSGSFTCVGLLAGGHVGRRWFRQRRDRAALDEKLARGQQVSRSLHPVIGPNICIGSLSCLKACPEG